MLNYSASSNKLIAFISNEPACSCSAIMQIILLQTGIMEQKVRCLITSIIGQYVPQHSCINSYFV